MTLRDSKILMPLKKAARKILMLKSIPQALNLFVPPGHFYSPIPSLADVRKSENDIWPEKIPRALPGLDLRIEEQLALMDEFQKYYNELPFQAQKTPRLRYFYENPAYCYSDAIFLYCMMRKLKPKKIIEIGCGYSSCVMMDTNELFFNNGIEMTFIDPYPDLLRSLMKGDDSHKYKILPQRLQDVDPAVFRGLNENDILFVDSTHVAKVNSDVNRIFFEILPALNRGAHIHFHDIFYPFEYPREWVYEGRAYNESYLLRAFLQYNSHFEIVFFNTLLEGLFKEKFEARMPLCLKNPGGSIWLKKVGGGFA